MAFSVQLAAEFTSAAAPRTVLQPATTSAAVVSVMAISLRTMVVPSFWLRNDHGFASVVCPAAERNQQLVRPLIAFSVQLATLFTSRAAPRTVLQAAVPSAAASRVTVTIL